MIEVRHGKIWDGVLLFGQPGDRKKTEKAEKANDAL